MGVPGLNRWLRQRIPGSSEPPRNHRGLYQNVNSLSFDANPLIYAAVNKIFGADAPSVYKELEYGARIKLVLKEITDHITRLLKKFVISDSLVIAFDGPPPYSKIIQQRARRYARMSEGGTGFNTAQISPGTQFMRDLDVHMREFLKTHKSELPPHVIYSSHRVNGEAEHKIFDFYRSYQVTGKNNHIIYGNDADLGVIALKAPLNNIYIVSEFREDDLRFINCNNVARGLKSLLSSEHAIDDFLVLLTVVGNDFLPPVPEFTTLTFSFPEKSDESGGGGAGASFNEAPFDKILDVYRKGKEQFGTLVRNGELNMEGIRTFFRLLFERENEFLEPTIVSQIGTEWMDAVGKERGYRYNLKTKRVEDIDAQVFKALWYELDMRLRKEDEYLVPLDHYEEDANTSINERVQAYFTCLNWIYHYYTKGTDAVNAHTYYPYNYAPVLEDLADIKYDDDRSYLDTSQEVPNVVFQLLCILPPTAKDFLPTEVRYLFQDDSMISDMIPKRVEKENPLASNSSDHRDVVILPVMDFGRVREAFEEILWTRPRIDLFIEDTNLIFNDELRRQSVHLREEIVRKSRREEPGTAEVERKRPEGTEKGTERGRGRGMERGRGRGGAFRGRGRGGVSERSPPITLGRGKDRMGGARGFVFDE